MPDFFRFPHTPHLTWLGEGFPRDDKVLSPPEVSDLLADEVIVEEKIDGANLGLSLDEHGQIRAQNRGQYLRTPYLGQFTRLPAWLAQHSGALHTALTPGLILFGEWCAARHSLVYHQLPDWFLLFDVYDRDAGRFWSVARRNALADNTGLETVHGISRAYTTLAELKKLVTSRRSAFHEAALEGIVVRRDSVDWCEARAKLVHPEFTQAIDTHWRKRAIEWNRLR